MSKRPTVRQRYLAPNVPIVYEDDDVLVIDKPAGLATVPPPGQDSENAFSLVKRHVRNAKKQRGTRAWIIHRLDREASGLLVFAKTEAAFEALKDEFRTKRVRRLYATVVEGAMPIAKAGTGAGAEWRTVQSFLAEDRDGIVHSTESPTRARRDMDDDADAAKRAVTHYRVLATGHNRSLLQVRLETGRKNQIRVHMADEKHPIVGDFRYGSKSDPINRVCLHAAELGFHHPATSRLLRFTSEVPYTFRMLVGMTKNEELPTGEDVATEDMRGGNDEDRIPAPTGSREDTDLKPTGSNPSASVVKTLARSAEDPGSADKTDTSVGKSSSWDHVAEWYDQLVGERGSDHHERVILPGTLRLLGDVRGKRVLDVASGQGILCRRLAASGASTSGVDAAPRLIALAKSQPSERPIAYHVGDARRLTEVVPGTFDAVTCIMALMNIDPLGPVMEGVASRLVSGGAFVAVMLHPAFRAPGQTSWGWEEIAPPEFPRRDGHEPRGRERGPERGRDRRPGPPSKHGHGRSQERSDVRQYRRVDGYLSPAEREIVMNPGRVASGGKAITTMTYHRPIQSYVSALAAAGLLVDALEEWPSLRKSQPGPRAAEENRIRREIPLFLAIRAVKR